MKDGPRTGASYAAYVQGVVHAMKVGVHRPPGQGGRQEWLDQAVSERQEAPEPQ